MKPMTDVVVLVDDHGHPIGTAPKATAVSYTHLTLPTNREV